MYQNNLKNVKLRCNLLSQSGTNFFFVIMGTWGIGMDGICAVELPSTGRDLVIIVSLFTVYSHQFLFVCFSVREAYLFLF